MSENPHHPEQPGGRQDPSADDPRQSGSGPAPVTTSTAPPMTRQLRWLLRLTIASFVVTVLSKFVATGSDSGGMRGPGGDASILIMEAYRVMVPAVLHAIIYVALRGQRQWGWIFGIVYFCLTVATTAFFAAMFLPYLWSGNLSGENAWAAQGLVMFGALIAVKLLWLVVAVLPGVRAGLRAPEGNRMPASPAGPRPVAAPPAMTRQLRWLLRLTIVSFVVGVVGRLLWEFGDMSVQFDADLAFVAVRVLVTAGLYALVYFGLRAQLWWGWIVGMVYFCLTILENVMGFAVYLSSLQGDAAMGPGMGVPAVLGVLVLTAVKTAWVVVALLPGSRAALR